MQNDDMNLQGGGPTVDVTGDPTVGAMLRAERIRRGLRLENVAQTLRIRLPYLQALEESRYRDLPGATYVTGFLRTYGDYLQLDSALLISRYRAEGMIEDAKAVALYRNVKIEGKFPGIGALILSVLLMAGAYAGWYFYSDRDEPGRAITEPVTPPVPTVTSAPLPSSPAVTSSDSGTNGPITPGNNVPAIAPQNATPDAAADLTTQPGNATVVSEQNSVTPSSEVAPVPPAGAGPQTPPPAGTASDTPAPGGTADTAGTDTPETPPAAVFGQKEGDVRIVLRAKMDSWVQITDQKGQPVWTQLMRKDEIYRVAAGSTLILTTGNAGGLEIQVDGKPIPLLGPVGVVKRDIILTPESLTAAPAQ